MSKYRKKTLVIVSFLGILITSILAINWYITNRLEAKIASILIRNIQEATDGFYTLTYDKLSIGLYNGELSISDLHFFPDSTVLNEWKKNDSLPREIVDLRFKYIHFEGVNLKLIKDKRNLRFTLFNIDEPVVRVTAPLEIGKTKITEPTQIDDPYILIKNYLDVLYVKELNLKNAKVEYIVEDSIKPAIYALSDTDFSIYNFQLDKDSYNDGKLLFSDNITFNVNHPQVLLSNKEFDLSIGKLRFCTIDSIIAIEGVKLLSHRDSLVLQSRVLNAQLDQIAFHGIAISRMKESMILTANKFLIDAPNINMNYYTSSTSSHKKRKVEDIIVQSASLHDLISPIINKVQVDSIQINDAMFSYSINKEKTKSSYSFQNLSIQAEKFIIDSINTSRYEFIHCDNFSIDAVKLKASIAELNYKMNIDSLSLNTKNSDLFIKNIELVPILNRNSTVSGSIRYIRSDNFRLENDKVSASDFLIFRPNVQIKMYSSSKSTENRNESDLNFPFYLDVIKIDNGLFKLELDSNYFSANNVNAVVHNFSFHNSDYIKNITANISLIEGNIQSSKAFFKGSDFRYNSFERNLEISKLKYTSNSLAFTADNLRADNLLINEIKSNSIKVDSIVLTTPVAGNNDFSFSSPQINATSLTWVPNNVTIGTLTSKQPEFYFRAKEFELFTKLKELNLDNIKYIDDQLVLYDSKIVSPNIHINKRLKKKSEEKTTKVSLEKINLENIFITDGSLFASTISPYLENIEKFDITMENIGFNPNSQNLNYQQIKATIPNIALSLDNGFYTLKLNRITAKIETTSADLDISNISLESKYPKFEHAYYHPKNKDWFGLNVDAVRLKNIDIPALLNEKKLYAKKLLVNDTYLYNLKNQNIKIQHNIMPLVYEELHKFPMKFRIDEVDVKNFNVDYEELAKGAEKPARIFFSEMNGFLPNFTNIVDSTRQYLDLQANGYLMGNGYFNALWRMPVSSDNDCFILNAELSDFYLKELNKLITPMAPAAIKSGWVENLTFNISASSYNADIDMRFLYNDLNVSLWRKKGDDIKNKKLYSWLANSFIKKTNNNKNKLREPKLEVIRDPYHSTFNYFWQILQPAVIESVGINERKQSNIKKIGNIYNSIKNFFKPKKKKEKEVDKI